MHPQTLAIHAGKDSVDDRTGGIATPIVLSTTFAHAADVAEHSGWMYQRYGDPNAVALEAALTALEGGSSALHCATGLAASSLLLQALPEGSHILLPDDCYFGVRGILETFGPRWGLSFDRVDMTDLDAVRAAFWSNTRCLWLETPSNPLLKVSDVATLSALARERGALTVVDATFATPLLLRTLDLGADVALHSCTKYLGGHSDVMGGTLVFGGAEGARTLARRCADLRKLLGCTASPFASWLVQRGLKTLACRLEGHQRNALALAQFLAAHAGVEAVHYPGLPDHPQHALAARQMLGFGGMLSFQVRGDRARTIAVASRLKLITNATSLGAVETLIEHRQSTEGPHSTTPANLLRLSVGLEHVDDLRADLGQALSG
jgi:cystathionine gamma-synthase